MGCCGVVLRAKPYVGGSVPGGVEVPFETGTGNAPGVAPVIEYQFADAFGYCPDGASGFAPGVTVPQPYQRYAGGPAKTDAPFAPVPRNGDDAVGDGCAGCVLLSGRVTGTEFAAGCFVVFVNLNRSMNFGGVLISSFIIAAGGVSWRTIPPFDTLPEAGSMFESALSHAGPEATPAFVCLL